MLNWKTYDTGNSVIVTMNTTNIVQNERSKF